MRDAGYVTHHIGKWHGMIITNVFFYQNGGLFIKIDGFFIKHGIKNDGLFIQNDGIVIKIDESYTQVA